ncbi:MAG: type II toxin-antitoxin system VapC family toxin [Trichodesmium sp. St16_bin4-tuft]|nr:type II toxin-antitoxin system VapC family toxin [Trichodesmium sp. St16_bin4-tuft]
MTERLIVLDTNVALFYLSGRLVNPLPNATYFVSVVTEIELLSYPNLTPVVEVEIRDFLAQIIVVDINYHIKELAIALRKNYKLKLPDAVVAATAQHENADLLTNDSKLMNLAEINTQSVQIY